MTRSIFDPTGNNAEHGGSAFTPPDADQISQLPEEILNPPIAEEEADAQSEEAKPGLDEGNQDE